ncbi:MAG: hypothetical protein HIU91_15475, partial [Acidobacteria bacterium]|nr:hypothetical protein [Acidobacteriota bacterium]
NPNPNSLSSFAVGGGPASEVLATQPRLLRNAADAPPGTPITAHLAEGRLRAKVTSTE